MRWQKAAIVGGIAGHAWPIKETDRDGGGMNDRASEAVIVAVLAFTALFIMAGGSLNFPRRVSLRWLLVCVTIIALVFGTISFLARLKN